MTPSFYYFHGTFSKQCIVIDGAEVYYRHFGGLKYKITFRVFRDCRNSPLHTSLKAEMLGFIGFITVSEKIISYSN